MPVPGHWSDIECPTRRDGQRLEGFKCYDARATTTTPWRSVVRAFGPRLRVGRALREPSGEEITIHVRAAISEYDAREVSMLHILTQIDPSDRAALRSALTEHLHSVIASRARGGGDRTLVARAEDEVRSDPAAHIRFDDTGLATLHAVDRVFQAGRFETPTIGELRRKAAEARRAAGEPEARLRFHVLDGASAATDIGALQADAPPGSLFQVASQFNCLEAPDAFVTDVASYFYDPTQGPRASISTFPGTLVRHYAAPRADGTRFVQQTGGPQLNLLEELCTEGLAIVTNGYLTTSSISRPAALAQALEERFDELRAGVHDTIEVVFGQDWDGPVPGAPHHTVAQVFSSTVAAGGYGLLDPADSTMIALVRSLQCAAYFGALLAAATLGKTHAVLTLVGGGVFGNPVPVIWESILWAADTIRPLLHRDLDVVVNGYNLGRHVPAATLGEAAAARGGALVVYDRTSVTVPEI